MNLLIIIRLFNYLLIISKYFKFNKSQNYFIFYFLVKIIEQKILI